MATDRMLQFFQTGHGPTDVATASEMFDVLAAQVVATLPMNPERTVCLRKLLEAKDAAVRTLRYQDDGSR